MQPRNARPAAIPADSGQAGGNRRFRMRTPADLAVPSGNRLERLAEDRPGQRGIPDQPAAAHLLPVNPGAVATIVGLLRWSASEGPPEPYAACGRDRLPHIGKGTDAWETYLSLIALAEYHRIALNELSRLMRAR